MQLELPRSRQGHGSRACYVQGCRHPDCCDANRLYQRAYRDGLRGTHDNRLGPFRVIYTRHRKLSGSDDRQEPLNG